MSTSPPIPLDIRQARLEDAGQLATLMNDMDEPQANAPPTVDATRMLKILEEMAGYPWFRAYIAHLDGEAVGSFSLLLFSSPTHGGRLQAVLDAVVIRRDRRGAGIGYAMLAMARAAGCYKMSLSSNLKRVEAHRMYERLGFRQHGISFSIALD